MISVQRWLTKTNKCFDLLEVSAQQASTGVRCLVEIIKASPAQRSLDSMGQVRKEHKRLTKELTSHLCVTFVTPLEREDIEELCHALNRVSKTAEKFIERYLISAKHVGDWDLSRETAMLLEAADLVEAIVKELCTKASAPKIRELNGKLQRIEADADRLMEASLQKFYSASEGTVQWVVQKDLTELMEKVFDRCRSVGNVTYWTLLKNT